MSETPTPETDAARMKGYGEFCGDWVALERHHYEKHPEGDVVFCEVAEKLERERDDALKEWDLAREGWSKALEERDEARRERDELRYALEWIVGQYGHEKTTAQLSHIFDPATPILASSGHPLDLVMAGIEPQANAYLIDRRWLTYGQTYRELTPAKADVIRRNAERFVKVVNAAREEVSVLKAKMKEDAK